MLFPQIVDLGLDLPLWVTVSSTPEQAEEADSNYTKTRLAKEK